MAKIRKLDDVLEELKQDYYKQGFFEDVTGQRRMIILVKEVSLIHVRFKLDDFVPTVEPLGEYPPDWDILHEYDKELFLDTDTIIKWGASFKKDQRLWMNIVQGDEFSEEDLIKSSLVRWAFSHIPIIVVWNKFDSIRAAWNRLPLEKMKSVKCLKALTQKPKFILAEL